MKTYFETRLFFETNRDKVSYDISLVTQALFSRGGAYRLEIISAALERVWSTAYTIFVLKNRRILSIVDWCQPYFAGVRINIR